MRSLGVGEAVYRSVRLGGFADRAGCRSSGCTSSHFLEKYFPVGVRGWGNVFLDHFEPLNTLVLSVWPGNLDNRSEFESEVNRGQALQRGIGGDYLVLKFSPRDFGKVWLVEKPLSIAF